MVVTVDAKPCHYDGFGINDSAGKRIATLNGDPTITVNGDVVRDLDRDLTGILLAASPELFVTLEELCVEYRDYWETNEPPYKAIQHCTALGRAKQLLDKINDLNREACAAQLKRENHA